jgi:hypothetical protein
MGMSITLRMPAKMGSVKSGAGLKLLIPMPAMTLAPAGLAYPPKTENLNCLGTCRGLALYNSEKLLATNMPRLSKSAKSILTHCNIIKFLRINIALTQMD